MNQIQCIQGDLLEQNVDVIINAWNRNVIPWWLLLPQGVSGAVKRRAGLEPFRELGRMGPIPLGQAVLTGPGRLPHKAIIHVAGINLLWRSSERSIRDSVSNAIRIALQHGFQSLAMPLVGAGSGSMKESRVRSVILDQLNQDKPPIDVRVVTYSRETHHATIPTKTG